MRHTPHPDTPYSSPYCRIFLDLLRRNPYTSRIWVELIWVTIFWLMELGASASPLAKCTSRHQVSCFFLVCSLTTSIYSDSCRCSSLSDSAKQSLSTTPRYVAESTPSLLGALTCPFGARNRQNCGGRLPFGEDPAQFCLGHHTDM